MGFDINNPDYQSNSRSKIRLYNCDCMEYLKSLKDNEIDLCIVDPPYGININMNIGRRKNDTKKHKNKKWDRFAPDKKYFNQIERVSKHMVVWGANNFSCFLKPSNGWIFWDKDITGNVDFSMGELAYTNIKNNIKIFKYRAQTNENYSEKIHPTQKPVQLYKWLLKNYAKEGDKILDTHGGSMSIAIACHDMKFDLDLCELDEDYFNAGKERYEKHASQLRMF